MVRVFLMSLARATSHWLRNKSSGSIKTWEDLKTKFLSKYCPPARTAKKMEEINNFQQEPDETLYQAWERFKELLMKCPQHYWTEMLEVILFYNGLDVPTRQILDSKGAIPTKTAADAKVALQEIGEYSQMWHNGTSRTRSTETSDGLASIQAQLNNLGREIKKVNEKVYAAQVGCEQCKGPHYTKDCPLKEEGKTLEEAYYTQFGAPFQQGGQYRAAALGFYQRNNVNPSYQERRQSMEESLRKFMSESAKRHEENSNLIKEIRASTDAAIRNQGASIKTLEIQIGQISKSISTTVEADMTPIRRIGSSQYAVSAQLNRKPMFESRRTTIPFLIRLNDYYCDEKKGSYGPQFLEANSYGASHIDNFILRKDKDPGSFTLPCYINNVCFDNTLVDLGASVSVMPLSTYLNLGLGELAHTKLTVELADRIVKYPKGIAENVLVGISLRERMELDLEARLMGETLVLNRSLDPLYGDYIELNDLNVPLELRRDQVDDLMPTIEEGKVIDEPMIDIIKTRNNEGFDEYLSFCDFDQKIHIDCAYNIRFSCMIGFEHVNANIFPPLSVNMMSRGFYNSIMKDKDEYKGKNVVGAFMNVPIFVRNFSVVTHFAVVENIDGYQDQDMGDIILGEPFCIASRVEARRCNGLITIHNGNDNVTYQMARSHSRFKHLSSTQCNKIKLLLKDLAGKEIDKVGEVSII
ncbi:ribonuclease H-like domain, reverse transcriptase, RNA-dependent DNA polymerase [Tanacetum coccineum]